MPTILREISRTPFLCPNYGLVCLSGMKPHRQLKYHTLHIFNPIGA